MRARLSCLLPGRLPIGKHAMTRYTDQVEIHAGLLTVPAWLFAQAFYLHRQRRLNRLVATDFTY
jgi:hypothetical protein